MAWVETTNFWSTIGATKEKYLSISTAPFVSQHASGCNADCLKNCRTGRGPDLFMFLNLRSGVRTPEHLVKSVVCCFAFSLGFSGKLLVVGVTSSFR